MTTQDAARRPCRAAAGWPSQNEHFTTRSNVMTEQEILAGLGEIIEEIVGVPVDEVTPSKSFVGDLDIDSLSMVEIAVAAQDMFGVAIPDDQLKDLTTVQDVMNYVSQNARRAA
jgi:acyl carrier protein